jgi:two-component system OmpR family response regulator
MRDSLANLIAPVVLVVDDDHIIRTVLGQGLGLYGFGVYLAGDGNEGLDVYRQHRSEIDLVLLDICMPGLDVCRC